MPVSYRSSLLGVLDLAYSLYLRARQPKTHYWFSTGYGDLQSYYDLVDRMMAEWKRDGLKRYLGGVPLQVSWQPVDSGDLAVLCPLQYRLYGIKALLNGGFSPPGRAWWEAYDQAFFKWGEEMEYTPWGNFQPSEKHAFGQLVLWPKEKTMQAAAAAGGRRARVAG